ncbi:unnamed protein product [Malus baccata var. baccata]
MACRHIDKVIYRAKHLMAKQNGALHLNALLYHSSEEFHEQPFPPESRYQKTFPTFRKLTKLTQLLKNVGLIDGRFVNFSDGSIIIDDLTCQGLYWSSIGTESVEESCGGIVRFFYIRWTGGIIYNPFVCFGTPSEREPVIVKSLSPVAQPHIRTVALGEVLNGLKSELDYLDYLSSGLKFLADTSTSVSCEHDFSSWTSLSPAKVIDSCGLQKWEHVLEMFNDLIDWLKNERELLVSVAKLEVTKEGLSQVKDVLTDTSTGHKEVRHQESLVQKKLTKTLGYSSKCLFALMLYYLYGHVRDIEVDVRGGVYSCGSENDFCLCMGRIVTSDVVWSGVRQLDRALGIFKFVWETAGVKGALQLQGHIWCVGAEARVVTYRGNSFFGTRISCLSNDCLTM